MESPEDKLEYLSLQLEPIRCYSVRGRHGEWFIHSCYKKNLNVFNHVE